MNYIFQNQCASLACQVWSDCHHPLASESRQVDGNLSLFLPGSTPSLLWHSPLPPLLVQRMLAAAFRMGKCIKIRMSGSPHPAASVCATLGQSSATTFTVKKRTASMPRSPSESAVPSARLTSPLPVVVIYLFIIQHK